MYKNQTSIFKPLVPSVLPLFRERIRLGHAEGTHSHTHEHTYTYTYILTHANPRAVEKSFEHDSLELRFLVVSWAVVGEWGWVWGAVDL